MREVNSTVASLMIEQYKSLRLEEVVTRNVFRIIWFSLTLYSSSVASKIRDGAIDFSNFSIWGLEPAGIFIVAITLYLASTLYYKHIKSKSLRIQEMLISLDSELKDYYVAETAKDNIRNFKSNSFLAFFRRGEEVFWFVAIIFILYFNLLPFLFAQ